MIRFVQIVEVPIYLLTIAVYSLSYGNVAWPTFFAIMAIVRLFTNIITTKNQ